MPHVEVLPNSSSHSAPGWHYVVDTGFDPSKLAINPKDRKRAAARAGGQRTDNELSARQQTAIARRIAELQRDNDPKQNIQIPGKNATPKTQNARRIIQYQRQIKHWLDDEEAQLALQQQAPEPRRAAQPRRVSIMPSAVATPSESTPAPSGTGLTQSTPNPPVDPFLSINSQMPAPLDKAELDALLAAPPLSYAASHVARPAPGGPPQRYFCDNCGYWGVIRCRKCGARVCGLECKDAHEATRCLKWV